MHPLIAGLSMAKFGQTSFRRILLSWILLLSVPILLVGEYVTYHTARKSLLDTAHLNLTESAVKKADGILDTIQNLKANLIAASQISLIQPGANEQAQKILTQLAKALPSKVQCLQLTNIKTGKAIASTCGSQSINAPLPKFPPFKPNLVTTDLIDVTEIRSGLTSKNNVPNSLSLVFSAPVYDSNSQLRYSLRIQSSWQNQEKDQPKSINGFKRQSLTGYTAIIAQNGKILLHRDPGWMGHNINEQKDAQSLAELIRGALNGEQTCVQLSGFDQKDVDLLVGYTAIPSPVTLEKDKSWIILAVTRLDYALAGLEEIQKVMLNLVLGLLAANLIVTLLVARQLSRPIERLGEYALSVQCRQTPDRIPYKFKIEELHQLVQALDGMIDRLKAWAKELETAWQEAKVANQLKNEFLATTSHELRTPLNAIIGCIRLVRDSCCDDREEEMDFLQKADDAAIHLLSIINDVLDIAKIESGTLGVKIESVDLTKLIKEVVDLQLFAIQKKGLELNWEKLEEVIIVQSDPAKLKQVLLNVLNNAVKFTDSGTITISNSLEKVIETSVENYDSAQASDDGGAQNSSVDLGKNISNSLENLGNPAINLRAIVTIQDTGIGIDPAQQHKLFQPFVMVDGTTTRLHGGAGLGLAISRNLIELMGGRISLYSAGKNKGCTLKISLPISQISHPSTDVNILEQVKTEK